MPSIIFEKTTENARVADFFWQHFHRHFSLREIEGQFGRHDTTYVACHQGRIIGAIVVSTFDSYYTRINEMQRSGDIKFLAIDQAYQKSAVFRELLVRALRKLRERNTAYVAFGSLDSRISKKYGRAAELLAGRCRKVIHIGVGGRGVSVGGGVTTMSRFTRKGLFAQFCDVYFAPVDKIFNLLETIYGDIQGPGRFDNEQPKTTSTGLNAVTLTP